MNRLENFTSCLRLPLVCQVVGLSPATVRRLIRSGDFPEPIRLSENAVAWRSTDVAAWVESRQAVKH